MEPNYVIVVQRSEKLEVFGPFVNFEEATRALNEEPSRFGVEEDCLDAFITPLQPLHYYVYLNKEDVKTETLGV